MKKYLLGVFAIALAVGLSAFTSAKKAPAKSAKTTNYYWFYVNKSLKTPSANISDSDATFIDVTTDDPTPPSGSPSCSSSNYDCLIYFTDVNKVTANGDGTYHINGSKLPDLVVTQRAS